MRACVRVCACVRACARVILIGMCFRTVHLISERKH